WPCPNRAAGLYPGAEGRPSPKPGKQSGRPARPEFPMRTTLDRIRHAILFELVGLIFLIGGGTILTGFDASALGVVGAVASLIATGWKSVFNPSFVRAMLRWRGSIIRTHRIRILPAVLFEAGLRVILLPFVAWVLGLTLWQAFLFDLVIAIF